MHNCVLPLLFVMGILGCMGLFFLVGSIFFGVALTVKFVVWIALLPIHIILWFFRMFFGILF